MQKKKEPGKIYDKIAEYVRVRSTFQYYEEGVKISKRFLNLKIMQCFRGKSIK